MPDNCDFAAYCSMPEKCIPAGHCLNGFVDIDFYPGDAAVDRLSVNTSIKNESTGPKFNPIVELGPIKPHKYWR